jgi:DNA-binding NarL/FixJ family response regulator
VGTLHSAGTVALVQGDLDAAEAYFREALEYATSHLARKIHPIEGLAVIAAHRGDGRRALRLGAACAVLRRQWGMDAPESDGPADPWGERVAAAVGAARAAVGEAAARRAAAEGAALSADDTVAYALTDREPDGPLTARERDVAALVADGLSTREIAARLGIADRTVDAHLDNIRAKLDLTSRTQVATWWARHRSQRS